MNRLESQLNFLLEIDKLKNILRQNLITDGSRRENDAEHSWHLAMTALTLREYAQDPSIDLNRVIKMSLLHDLVEIYAGDTFCYDDIGNTDKAQREKDAANLLFNKLPSDQASEYRALWEEFDEMKTPDALYAAAVDRLQPFLNNSVTNWHTWSLQGVTKQKVLNRMAPVKEVMPKLWDFIEKNIRKAIKDGRLAEND